MAFEYRDEGLIEITADEYEEKRRLLSELRSGCNNPMYGRSGFENKSEDEMKIIGAKITARNIEYYKKYPDAQKGANNSNHKKVRCIETGEIFDHCLAVCKKYNIPRSTFSCACHNGREVRGYHYEFI